MHEMLLVDWPKYATMSLNNTQILKVKQLQNRNKKDNNWQKINNAVNFWQIQSSAKETWL